MRDVVPTGVTRDSEYLFARMTDRTLALAGPRSGARILDVASGFGQDTLEVARRGATGIGVEPSARMSALARLQAEKARGAPARWVRAWSDVLPFADATFDGVFCKGSLDHFERPAEAIAEMARVTKPDGRVVLAIANFDSLSCRAARAADALREDWLRREPRRGRRHHDVPSDHFTRYELPLMREQAGASLELDVVEGISLCWGLASWSRAIGRLPGSWAQTMLTGADGIARRVPALADVVVLAGRPRRSSTTSR